MTTPNTGIPYVPEGTLDPAAGLNLALNVIDALLQVQVIALGENDPPGSPVDGDLYIVGAGTGDWAGEDDNLARYVEEGDFWQFYEAGTEVRMVLSGADIYVYNGSAGWEIKGGLPDAPSDGEQYVRKDGDWEILDAALKLKTVSTDTYNLIDDDAFHTILFTHVSGCVVTIRQQATHAFRTGFWATLVQRSTGQVSVVGSGSAAVSTSASFEPATAQLYSPITVERYAENNWQVNGERQAAS